MGTSSCDAIALAGSHVEYGICGRPPVPDETTIRAKLQRDACVVVDAKLVLPIALRLQGIVSKMVSDIVTFSRSPPDYPHEIVKWFPASLV